jgi:hypothetical protein
MYVCMYVCMRARMVFFFFVETLVLSGGVNTKHACSITYWSVKIDRYTGKTDGG